MDRVVALTPPLSKSDAHRVLVLRELCEGAHESALEGAVDVPEDVLVLSRGLKTLRGSTGELDCHDAGAPFRFLLTQAALRPNTVFHFTGTKRLAERPQRPLLDALVKSLGVRFTEGAPWPLTVTTRATPIVERFEISGVESSQFASSLVLGAARLAHHGNPDIVVDVTGEPTSAGYLALTLDWVRRFGFRVDVNESRITIGGRGTLLAPSLPGDWSSLTYLLSLAWKSKAQVAAVDLASMHPDRAFATHLEAAGLTLVKREGLTEVHGALRRGFSVDASICPDAVPGLVALALVAPTASTFTRCAVLRLKESDRLAALIDLVHLTGGATSLEGDTLTVTPPRMPRSGTFDGRADHRLVMAAAVAGHLLDVTISVRGTEAVAKSFPAFWKEAAKAHVTRKEAE
ncbi:MAG: 3-phosphoshikimate 1-carboxyvinyltransferase [Myxococcaceae bacterium]